MWRPPTPSWVREESQQAAGRRAPGHPPGARRYRPRIPPRQPRPYSLEAPRLHPQHQRRQVLRSSLRTGRRWRRRPRHLCQQLLLPQGPRNPRQHRAAPGKPFRKLLDPASWPAALEYLSRHRSLNPAILDAGFRQRILGADHRANAVFITRDAERTPAGAELLGTQPDHPFRGMAPGSRKARGGFWITRRTLPQSALIVESALDALSAFELPCMQDTDLFLSTAGLSPQMPPWIAAFRLQDIACGYDADPPGDQAAERLIRINPNIRRIRPTGEKDWNDILQSRKRNPLQNP